MYESTTWAFGRSKSARECVCARTLDGSKSSSMACKGAEGGQRGRQYAKERGRGTTILYNKNRLKKIWCPEEEKQGFRNLHSGYSPGMILVTPWTHGHIGFMKWACEIKEPLRRHPTGAVVTYVKSTFQRVVYDYVFWASRGCMTLFLTSIHHLLLPCTLDMR